MNISQRGIGLGHGLSLQPVKKRNVRCHAGEICILITPILTVPVNDFAFNHN
jgi:hypothetical protein